MTPARIVIRPPNWLGDAVLALPAMAAVRAKFPDAVLDVAAAPAVAALLREDTDVGPDHVIDLPSATRAAVALLKSGAYDLGVLFPNSFRSAWQFRQAGIKERWGVARAGRSLLLTRRTAAPDRRVAPHQMDYYRAVIEGLRIPCTIAAPRVRPTAGSLTAASAVLAQHRVPADGPLVGLAPGAAYGQAEQWPADRVADLVARLVREHRATCIMFGAAHDVAAARAIESTLRARAPEAAARLIDLTGRTTLGALSGVMSRCRVIVSNDSGAMHLAAALGRPVVAVFGPTNERATRPIGEHDVIIEPVFCRPCMLRDCPIDHRCMTRIPVERVFAAAVSHLVAPHA